MGLLRTVALLVVCINLCAVVGCYKNEDRGAASNSSKAGADTNTPEIVDGPRLLSANALYREFQNNPIDASNKYAGKTVVLEGLRGDIVLTSDGVGAAVHIADGGKPNALILSFSDRNDLAGINQGQKFRFRCTVRDFKYSLVWMEDCTIERG